MSINRPPFLLDSSYLTSRGKTRQPQTPTFPPTGKRWLHKLSGLDPEDPVPPQDRLILCAQSIKNSYWFFISISIASPIHKQRCVDKRTGMIIVCWVFPSFDLVTGVLHGMSHCVLTSSNSIKTMGKAPPTPPHPYLPLRTSGLM